MAGSPNACLFCGRTGQKLTAEHVYPKWLRDALHIRGDVTYTSGDVVKRTEPTLDVKVREVCADCNNGWMHDLEDAFAAVMRWPMNGFGPIQMPKAVQLTVATWAVKTGFLIERSLGYIRGPQPVDPEHGVFRILYERRQPPDEVQVFVGAVNARGSTKFSFVATQWVGATDPPAGIAQVFTIGCVLFLVYSPVTLRDAPWPAPFYRLGIGDRLAPYLRQIWPHQVEEVRWPPDLIFPLEDLAILWPSGGRIMVKPPQ